MRGSTRQGGTRGSKPGRGCQFRCVGISASPTGLPAPGKPLRVAGLMSGTSADGVDAAIVEIRRPRLDGGIASLQHGGKQRPPNALIRVRSLSRRMVHVLAFDTFPYPPALRRGVLALSGPEGSAEEGGLQAATQRRSEPLCHLNFVLGEVFASALIKLARRAGIALDSISLIGSHGQTIRHEPRGRRFGRRRVRSTLQIGEPAVIAERTGIATVANFRGRDIAAGGQGAPLVPYADFVLFADRRLSRAVQNIGGIANVTYLPAGGQLDLIVAFDTGPGNMVIDRVVFLATRGRQECDRGGRIAARGKVCRPLLAELMRHPYFRRRPPKSTGREEFGWKFADGLYRRARSRGIPGADLVATVTALTAESIADAYKRFLHRRPDEVILCGGGARNPTLVRMLRERLAPAKVKISDEFGINADAKEAVSFALLAEATARGCCNNVPSATGASRPVVLGVIVPAGGPSGPGRA